jgi:hypothetical protein
MTRIAITSPSYSPSIGGVVVLHKLCDILLTLGYDAYLYPFGRFQENQPYYVVNPDYKSQILTELDTEKDIVIYPEIQPGNPAETKNVVRYILNRYHLPDYDNYMSSWGDSDFWLYHDNMWYDGLRDKNILTIRETKLNFFENLNLERNVEACFTYRKKHHEVDNLNIIHPPDAIEIPFSISDEELLQIFNKCKKFYSYDLETYLNVIAVACGCESIIVPYKNLTKQESSTPKNGVAYGLDDLEYAKNTTDILLNEIKQSDIDQYKQTDQMIKQIFNYFNL